MRNFRTACLTTEIEGSIPGMSTFVYLEVLLVGHVPPFLLVSLLSISLSFLIYSMQRMSVVCFSVEQVQVASCDLESVISFYTRKMSKFIK